MLAIVDLWNVGLLTVVLDLDDDLNLFGFDFDLFDDDLNLSDGDLNLLDVRWSFGL